MADKKNNIENNHYSEEAIALFALGEKFPDSKRKEFFDHLEACFSCKQLYEEMSEYYEAADKPELLLVSGEEKDTNKQDLKPQYKSSFFSALASSNYYVPAKWVSFVFRQPVLSGGGFLFVVALIALALNFKALVKDNNPVSYKIDDKDGEILFFNKNKELLWKLLISDNVNVKYGENENMFQVNKTLLADLNNDNINEIITSHVFRENSENRSYLYVYNYKGDLIGKKDFPESPIWRGDKYPSIYASGQLILNPDCNEKNPDFFVVYNSHNAPGRILRLNKDLNIVGELWHRGHFDHIYAFKNEIYNKNLMFLCCLDDLMHNATLVIIDPDKLYGKNELGSTYGYNYGLSPAVLFEIQFPETDVIKTLGERESTTFIQNFKECYQVFVGIRNPTEDRSLLFYFTKDFKLITVRTGSGYQNVQNRLFEEGKVKEKWSSSYQKKLMDGVRYWNGKEWQKERFMLNQGK
jgi:hypothetical protein